MQDFTYSDFEIIDTHSHIFPERISEKAAANIGAFYDLPMDEIGDSLRLIESGKKIGVKKYLVCSTATSKEQTESINNFIKAKCDRHSEFFGFGTLHPKMDNMEEEVERIISMGLHGIKIHPDFQKFNIDDKQAYKIYELIENRIPILIHMGDERYEYSRPHRLANVVKDFPKLKILAAHLGGYQRWDEAMEFLSGSDNLKFDTCSSLEIIPKEFAVKLIRHYGVENCLFGTDFPMWNHEKEIKRFLSLGLTYEENRRILSENFKGFFNLEA